MIYPTHLPEYCQAHYPDGSYLVMDRLRGEGPFFSEWDPSNGEPPTPEQVAAWDPTAHLVRLYDYAQIQGDPAQPPTEYDFGLAPLHKHVADVWQGDQRLIVYYAEPTHETPVVQRAFAVEYLDGPPRVQVTETISWYCNDGSLHPTTKQLLRVYAGQRWLDWLEGKRRQIVEWLRWHVAAAMIANLQATGPFEGGIGTISDLGGVMAEGGAFFGEYGALISAYVGGYAQAFPQAVAADSRPWLDLPWPGEQMTIRDKFAEQLIYT